MALTSPLDAIERLPAFSRILNTMPAPAARLRVGGLPGSADATLVAALARRLPTRFFVVAADSLAEAERWLADLETLLDDTPVALYPPREGFGEAEPHMEVAGERVETLERLSRGERRVGALVVNAPAEESNLDRFTADELTRRLQAERVVTAGSADAWSRMAFRAAARRSLIEPALIVALILLGTEAVVIGARARRVV